ncbi:hypothetical protein CFAM422_003313 [Trichoderma lentiforme]|uniref:Uncharacterized protein n=1 Tax=Trichoderma lentiforme TaxID=1567552 RepID=A0A9P4XKF5_9HYPO|nr:hypothetical protein CFAM422_003313 [Trichoderma lentiforme]
MAGPQVRNMRDGVSGTAPPRLRWQCFRVRGTLCRPPVAAPRDVRRQREDALTACLEGLCLRPSTRLASPAQIKDNSRAQSIPTQPSHCLPVQLRPFTLASAAGKSADTPLLLAPEQPSKPSQGPLPEKLGDESERLDAGSQKNQSKPKPLDWNWRYRCSAGQKTD